MNKIHCSTCVYVSTSTKKDKKGHRKFDLDRNSQLPSAQKAGSLYHN